MSRAEREDYEDPAQYREAVREYALQLAEAEAFVAVYPTWWYGLPAMLKGYFDRVWAPGIAFDMGADGAIQTDRLDNIRKLGVVTTYVSVVANPSLYGQPGAKTLGPRRSANYAPEAARSIGMFNTIWTARHRSAWNASVRRLRMLSPDGEGHYSHSSFLPDVAPVDHSLLFAVARGRRKPAPR
jgi:putative NADPH-quinone reductase